MSSAPSTTSVSTPLVFFPPKLAYQISVATYIHVGCTAVLIWDILDNIKDDWKILVAKRLNLATVLYFTTRLSLLTYTLTRALLITLPLGHCAKIYDALNALLIVFVATTFALFYIRIYALYKDRSKIVVIFYFLLWLAVVGMLMTIPQTFTAIPIADTQYCGENVHGPFLGPLTLVLSANDVLVYAGIAYYIFEHATLDSSTNSKFKLFAFGKSLPIVSKALLTHSQRYLLIVLFTNPFLVACVYVWNAPLSVMFLVIHLVLTNIFSCRVYRNIKMQRWSDDPIPLSNSYNNQAVFIRNVTERTTDVSYPAKARSTTSVTTDATQNGGAETKGTVTDEHTGSALSDSKDEVYRVGKAF